MIDEVLEYLDTNMLPKRGISEGFIIELDLQIQIEETELEDADLRYNNALVV